MRRNFEQLSPPNPAWAWAVLVWVLCAAVTCGVLVLALTWNHVWTAGPDPRWQFDALTPTGARSLVALTVAIWAFAGLLIARATRRVGMVVTASILIPIATAVGVGFWSFTLPTWSERGRTTAADGRTYVHLEDHQFAGVLSSIAVVHRKSLVVETVEILEHGDRSPGDAGFVLVPVDGDPSEESTLMAQRDGGVAVVRCEPGWATGALFARGPDGAECGVDPFVLFDDDDVGDDAELEKWVGWLRSKRRAFGRPTSAALLTSRDHPNAWVRAASRRLIAADAESTAAAGPSAQRD